MASDYYFASVMSSKALMDMGSELEYAAQAGHREIQIDPMRLAHMLMLQNVLRSWSRVAKSCQIDHNQNPCHTNSIPPAQEERLQSIASTQ